jgi:hypothetical protein
MNDNTNALVRKFSLPMRWLALAAAVEMGLEVLAASAVQSEPLHSSPISATTPSPLVGYARAVSDALVRTETGVLPVVDQQ